MNNSIYGVCDSDLIHYDTSLTIRGAKRFATLNGYKYVSIRYNSGYNIDILFTKKNGKWLKV